MKQGQGVRGKIKTKTKVKIKVKGDGQECPSHTGTHEQRLGTREDDFGVEEGAGYAGGDGD